MPNTIDKILNKLPVKIDLPKISSLIFKDVCELIESDTPEIEINLKKDEHSNNLFHFAAISELSENKTIYKFLNPEITKFELFRKICKSSFFISALTEKNSHKLSALNILYILNNKKIIDFIIKNIEQVKISEFKEKNSKKLTEIEDEGFISNLVSSLKPERQNKKLEKIIEIYETVKSSAIEESESLKLKITNDPFNTIEGCISNSIHPGIIIQLILLSLESEDLSVELILSAIFHYDKNFYLLRYFINLKIVDINSINERNETALFLAFNKKNIDFIKFILEFDIDINKKSSRNEYAGFLCLSQAIDTNNMDLFDLVISKKFRLDLCDDKKNTLLNYAILKKNKIMVYKILLNEKYLLVHKNNKNQLPIDIYLSEKINSIEILNVLLDFFDLKKIGHQKILKETIINFTKTPENLLDKKPTLLILLKKLSDNKFTPFEDENLCYFSIRVGLPIEIINELLKQYEILKPDDYTYLIGFLLKSALHENQESFNILLSNIKLHYTKKMVIKEILNFSDNMIKTLKEEKSNISINRKIICHLKEILKELEKEFESQYDNTDTTQLMSLARLINQEILWLKICTNKNTTLQDITTAHQKIISLCDEMPNTLKKEKYEKIKWLTLFIGILLILAVGAGLMLFIPSISTTFGITTLTYCSQYLPEIASGIIAISIAATNYLNQHRYFSAPLIRHNMSIFAETSKKFNQESTTERAIMALEKLVPISEL